MSRTPPTPEEQDAVQEEQKVVIPKITTYNPARIGLTLDDDDVTLTALIPGEMVNVNIPVLAFEALVAEYAKSKAEESGIILPDAPQLVVP